MTVTTAATYEAALARARRDGIRNCDDAALMASFLDGSARILIGAVSPRLVWEGAQARSLTTKELAQLIRLDPRKAADLMWETA